MGPRPSAEQQQLVPEFSLRGAQQASGLVLADPGASTNNGTQMIQWPWQGGSEQQWTFVSLGNGNWLIRQRV